MKAKPELTKRDRLLSELTSAAESIDEEGLVFLLEQANVLLHNARVLELEARRESEPAGEEAGEPSRPRKRTAATASIELSADGKAYFLVLGEVRKSMARPELNAILKICSASPDVAEAARRLYAYMARERRDILVDAGITDASATLLRKLAEHARGRQSAKGDDP